ncbi:hypothetical protein ACVWZN_001654 [Lysobacter sp. HA35]
MLQLAALLIAILGLAHSVLGERYILTRLFRRDLPEHFGGAAVTRNTLRFAWHLTTVLAFGLSVVLVQLAGSPSPKVIARTLGWCFIASGVLPLLFTRGRHLAWVVLFAAGGLCLIWAAP